MAKRSEHAIYDLKYHLVWVPKYRKSLLVGAIEKRLREVFGEIASHHGLEIVELELMPDHYLCGAQHNTWLAIKT